MAQVRVNTDLQPSSLMLQLNPCRSTLPEGVSRYSCEGTLHNPTIASVGVVNVHRRLLTCASVTGSCARRASRIYYVCAVVTSSCIAAVYVPVTSQVKVTSTCVRGGFQWDAVWQRISDSAEVSASRRVCRACVRAGCVSTLNISSSVLSAEDDWR